MYRRSICCFLDDCGHFFVGESFVREEVPEESQLLSTASISKSVEAFKKQQSNTKE